jgi:hypothetical protein
MAREPTADFSWASLFKISALFLPLAGFLAFCGEAVQVYLDTLTLPTMPSGDVAGLAPVGFHASLFNTEYSLLCLAVLAFVPAVIALFVALRGTDVGISTVAASLAIIGVVFVLFAAVGAFTEIQEAVVWDGGCSACGTTPVALAAGASTLGVATQLGELLVIVGILVISILMLRSTLFSKVSGIIGIVAALYALAGSFFLFASLSEMDSDIGSALTFVLITLWGMSVAPRLLRLGRVNANPTDAAHN